MSPRRFLFFCAAITLVLFLGIWIFSFYKTSVGNKANIATERLPRESIEEKPSNSPSTPPEEPQTHRDILIPQDAIANHLIIQAKDPQSFQEIIELANTGQIKLLDLVPQTGWILLEVKHSHHANDILRKHRDLIRDSDFNYTVQLPSFPGNSSDIPPEDIIADGFGFALASYLGIPDNLGDWGQGVKVAVIDSGIRPSAIFGNSFTEEIVLIEDNIINPDANNHGTSVASLISGQNNSQIQGIARGSEIISLDAFDSLGTTDTLTLAKAITIATDQGVKVINASLGSSQPAQTQGALHQALQYAKDHDVVTVVAAGNENSAVASPANSELTLAVGSINNQEARSSFSNYGEEIDLVAPGTGVLAYWDDDVYYVSGTSYAAPIVSAIIAGIRSSFPDMTGSESIEFLLAHTKDIGESGKDAETGLGTVQVDAIIDSILLHGGSVPLREEN